MLTHLKLQIKNANTKNANTKNANTKNANTRNANTKTQIQMHNHLRCVNCRPQLVTWCRRTTVFETKTKENICNLKGNKHKIKQT